jgi:hypothetical protein
MFLQKSKRMTRYGKMMTQYYGKKSVTASDFAHHEKWSPKVIENWLQIFVENCLRTVESWSRAGQKWSVSIKNSCKMVKNVRNS